METLVTAAQMAKIDGVAQDQGIPGMVLMENAGRHALRIWLRFALSDAWSQDALRELGAVVAVAGSGNNGGDALVMARECSNLGIPVTAVLSKGELKGSVEQQRRILESMGVPLLTWDDSEARRVIAEARWIFDGVAGTGIRGELRGTSRELVEAMNRSNGSVLAVDLPSGTGDEYRPGFAAVEAVVTVTMGLKKRCLYHPGARELAGTIEVGDPGFPRALLSPESGSFLVGSSDLPSFYPALEASAHKGTRGFLGLFAGSEGTSGAAVLAGRGALHAGCGLARIHTDPGSRAEIAAGDPALMVDGLDLARLDELNVPDLVSRYSALAVGPGWGVSPGRYRLLAALATTGLPGVLDADGLNNLASRPGADHSEAGDAGELGHLSGWVLTPHPGEAARLLRRGVKDVLADPAGAAAEIAGAFEATVLLKGAVSVVSSPEGKEWFVEGMNPALATAGSGDVLAGVIGGLLARGAEATEAAVAGALLHQEAGARLFGESGWFAASALPEAIGKVAGEL
ncbi:MAG: NAD(P)H-hydrate dehydratase [Spirochaetaceae bacterium]